MPTKKRYAAVFVHGLAQKPAPAGAGHVEDYPTVEGLFYASSMDGNRPAVALYERAQRGLPVRPLFHRALADPGLTGAVAKAALLFNYAVDP